MPNLPSASSIHLTKALMKLVDCAFFSMELCFHPLSDFDTFELFGKAINSIVTRIAQDITKIPCTLPGSKNFNADKDVDLHRARWKSGPLYLSLYCDDYEYDDIQDPFNWLESMLGTFSNQIEALMKKALHFFSDVDMTTMRKLYPEKVSEISLLQQQQSEACIITTQAVMNHTKRSGHNYKMPPMEWEVRCRKLRKFLRPCIEKIENILISLKHRKAERNNVYFIQFPRVFSNILPLQMELGLGLGLGLW